MSDLIDRISGDSELQNPPRPSISAHHFTAYVVLWGTGKVNDQVMVNLFDLQDDELSQASAIRAVYTAKNQTNKFIYIHVITSIFIALAAPTELRNSNSPYFNADGSINRTNVLSALEI